MTISTLVVGFGYAAKTFHVPFLTHLADFEINAVVSSDPAKVHDQLPESTVFASLEQALAASHFDLVVITTPNHLHAPQTKAALEAGCHVLVEKPFTLDSEEGESLVALAKQVGKQLCVFHNRRFDGDYLTIKQLIAEQAIGKVKRFESRFDRFRPHPRQRWREQEGPGAGIFWDLGPHLIDQCVQLWGMPNAVNAHILTQRDGGEANDAFEISLFYGTHFAQLGSTPFEAGATIRFALHGDKGSYRKHALDPQEDQLKAGLRFDDPKWAKTPDTQEGTLFTESDNRLINTQSGDYMGFYQQLADAIRLGSPLPADAETVVPVIRLIELAIKSSQKQCTVPVV